MPIRTYTPAERTAKIEQALELRYTDRKNWEEVAKALDIARSTLNEWRKEDEYKEADLRWRRSLRDKARGDSSQMLDDAVVTLYELMTTDRSGYVRYMAACKILDMNQVGNELEETIVDGQKELADFLLKQAKHQGRVLPHGELIVQPGGLLPAGIQALNESHRDQTMQSLETIEAEFHAASSTPLPSARESER